MRVVLIYDLSVHPTALYQELAVSSARYFLTIAVVLRSGHVYAQVAAARFARIAPCWRLGYAFAHRKFAWGAILREASFCGHVSEA